MAYDAPWLYGAAASPSSGASAAASTGFSDTVAGACGARPSGRFSESSRLQERAPRVLVSPNGVSLAWKF
jgi:hypothetical protein